MTPELEDYAAVFDRFHRHFAEALAALPPTALNWRPPLEAAGANSPAAIARHVAGAQRYWIGEVLGGQPAHRNRDAEFSTPAASAAELVGVLEAANTQVRATLAALDPANLDQSVDYGGETVSQRRLIVRMLTHTAEHWGELMLARQLWEQAHPA
jgi:uncharacterized damage-inducible protein DinB